MDKLKNKSINSFDKTTSFIDVFSKFKNIINNDLHVSTLALFKSIEKEYNDKDGYGIINVVPFPLNQNEASQLNTCYYFNKQNFTKNQLLLVIYTDLDFKDNLQVNKTEAIKNDNPLLHSKMSAVLINISSNGTFSE